MPICENCKTTFEYPPGPREIASTRILCLVHEREYLAEKQRRAAAKGTAQPVPAQVPKPAASKPSPGVPARPAGAINVVAQAAAKRPAVAEQSASSAKPAAAKPLAAKLAAAKPAAAKPAAPKSAPRTEPREESAKPNRSRDVQREVAELKSREDRLMKMVWGIAGGAILIAAGAYFVSKSKQEGIRAEAEAAKAEIAATLQSVEELPIDTEAQCELVITRVKELDESRKIVPSIRDKVLERLGKARRNQDLLRSQRELSESFEKVMVMLRNPSSVPLEALAEARRNLSELSDRADVKGPEFVAQVAEAKNKAETVYVERAQSDARALASTNPREALSKYALVEDELVRMLDEATNNPAAKESRGRLTSQFQDFLIESDALAEKAFSEDVIEKTPWKELLTGEQALNWNPAKVAGFTSNIDSSKGVMVMRGPDPGQGQGITSIGDREKWRDFVFETDFTVQKGIFDVYVRLGKRADNSCESFPVLAGPDSNIQHGETYQLKVTLVGSKIKIETNNPDEPTVELPVKWIKSRKGAIGLVLPDGAQVKFSNMRIKVLR